MKTLNEIIDYVNQTQQSKITKHLENLFIEFVGRGKDTFVLVLPKKNLMTETTLTIFLVLPQFQLLGDF